MEQQTQASAQAQKESAAVCGMSLRSHSQPSWLSWYTLRRSDHRVQVVVWQWCSAGTEAAHTGVYSPSASALRRSRHSPSLPILKVRRFGLSLCHIFFFHSIVMAKCIFLMSCIAEETIPAGPWRCLLFLMCISFGTTFYNDFLLLLFVPWGCSM